jgi:REP element-mobilizing transposase RayT
MRLLRVKSDGHGFYHCISRAVHSLFIFRTTGHGSEEADHFVRLMRGIAAFCGVHVLEYVLMSNHFHLLCEVPKPVALSETEVLDRNLSRVAAAMFARWCQENFFRYMRQHYNLDRLWSTVSNLFLIQPG